ncbi:MAG: hypothetical protein PHD65_05380 [Gallionella sp.]|nr:hypothetical protein [Gallionella sp.]
MEPDKTLPFSIQAEIIRLIQVTKGQDSCYAAPVNGECSKTECSWRNDCFDEASELFPALRVQQPAVAKSFNIPAEIIKLLQTGDGQNA